VLPLLARLTAIAAMLDGVPESRQPEFHVTLRFFVRHGSSVVARSHFLVHWTGKDISTGGDPEPVQDAYVDRLFDILQSGFWMTRPTEHVVGGNIASPGQVSFDYHADMTCFTEVRLSAAASHAAQYGSAGIAVDRRFVLDRWGSPVHYVRNAANEHIVESFSRLRHLLQNEGQGEALRAAEYLGVFLKPMSPPNTDSFTMLDEHEWRIVVTKEKVDFGHIKESSNPTPRFRLLIPPEEVRLLVLPDEPTRKKALADARIHTTLWDHKCYPPILTLPECANL
jgi:hypothetical protein